MHIIGKKNDNLIKLAKDLGVYKNILLDCNKHITSENVDVEFEIIKIPGMDDRDGFTRNDLEPYINKLQSLLITTNKPYDSQQFYNDVKILEDAYPFMKKRVIGLSVLGKPIYEFRIGKGDKVIHYNAGMHANEWITSMALMLVMNDYLLHLTNDSNMRDYYDTVTVSFVPMINPDGIDLSIKGPITSMAKKMIEMNKNSIDFTEWKSNINGVDLNDQFPALWEKEKSKSPQIPGPRDYGGEAPLTEPESQALANLTKRSNFSAVYALHTQGQEIYWGFEGLEPEVSEIMVETYAQVSGYRAVRYVDSYAGYKDWFIQEYQLPGFTMELGFGKNPLPIEQIGDIFQEIRQIYYYSLNF